MKKIVCLTSFATVLLTFSACAVNSPAPATDVVPVDTNAEQTNASIEASKPGNANTTSAPQETSKSESTSSTAQQSTTSSANEVPPEIIAEPISPVENPIDPYIAFPALADSVFDYAYKLYNRGEIDSATAYLERFRIIKPLWNTWEARADSILFAFGKTRAEKIKRFEPLVLEIQNMNRAQAAYSMVASTADSLIAMDPGDSLTTWANAQKQIAYKNTLSKAQKDYASIKALADDQAKFDEAKKKASEFQMRYRDFEDTLHIQALIDHIAELASATNTEAIAYWQKNDPAKALAKADSLIKTEKFSAAKELLNKLKASNLRAQAIQKYKELGDAFCNKQRKATSQIFAKAQKQKDIAKKQALLRDAIAPLDKCLAEYPENSQKQKVLENKQFLEKELAK
ncbi:MAG: hypothetical protein MJY82_06300 [Fibrobacter sp.]|nr:hypothetical protein [Fibrobacter sp.]